MTDRCVLSGVLTRKHTQPLRGEQKVESLVLTTPTACEGVEQAAWMESHLHLLRLTLVAVGSGWRKREDCQRPTLEEFGLAELKANKVNSRFTKCLLLCSDLAATGGCLAVPKNCS